MKKHIAAIVSCLALATLGLHAQTTNASSATPPAMAVTQPVASTSTVYRPAVVYCNAATTASFATNYLIPMQTAAGVTTPTGALTASVTIQFFADGSSITHVASAATLPPALPPAAIAHLH